jgi:hypothetical protein
LDHAIRRGEGIDNNCKDIILMYHYTNKLVDCWVENRVVENRFCYPLLDDLAAAIKGCGKNT